MAWADTEFPAWPLTPTDPVARFMSLLIEDFADEWLWRPAMHYRWSFYGDRENRSDHLAAEVTSGAERSRPRAIVRRMIKQRQIGTFVRGDGVDASNREHVDQSYVRILDMLEPIMQSRPYLLGDQALLDDVPADWDPLLEESAQTHLEQLNAHAEAHDAGEVEHDLTVQGFTYRQLPTAPYRVWCLEQHHRPRRTLLNLPTNRLQDHHPSRTRDR